MTGQQITTAEELDALPVGSVVRSGDGQIWERCTRSCAGWDCLSEDGDAGLYAAETVVFQTTPPQATVLYRPDVPMSESSGQAPDLQSGDDTATPDRLADVAAAVSEAYEPTGQAIWWRSWAQHPESRAAAEAGVLGAWSNDFAVQEVSTPPSTVQGAGNAGENPAEVTGDGPPGANESHRPEVTR